MNFNKKYKIININKKLFIFFFFSFFLLLEGSNENNEGKQEAVLVNDSLSQGQMTAYISALFRSIIYFSQDKIQPNDMQKIYVEFLTLHPEFSDVLQKLFETNPSLGLIENKLLFSFLYTFCIELKKKCSLEVFLPEINFDSLLSFADLKNGLDLFAESISKVIPLDAQNGLNGSKENSNIEGQAKAHGVFDDQMFENLSELTQKIITLVKNIIDNLSKNKYNKSIFDKFKKTIFNGNKSSSFIAEYQSILSNFLQQYLGLGQENILELTTLRSNFAEISDEKKQEVFFDIIEKSIQIMSFAKHCMEEKFLPHSSAIKEFQALQKKMKKNTSNEINKAMNDFYVKQRESLFKGARKQSSLIQKKLEQSATRRDSSYDPIKILNKMIESFIEDEHELCLYGIQNVYRAVYLNGKDFLEKNLFTKAIKFVFSDRILLASIYFGVNVFRYLHPYNEPEDAKLALMGARTLEFFKEFQLATPAPQLTASEIKRLYIDSVMQRTQGENTKILTDINNYENNIAVQEKLKEEYKQKYGADSFQVNNINESIGKTQILLKEAKNLLDINVNGAGDNYSGFFGTHLRKIKEMSSEDAAFNEALKTGKFSKYDERAKSLYRNNITNKEYKDVKLLEEQEFKNLTIEGYESANEMARREKAKKVAKEAHEIGCMHDQKNVRQVRGTVYNYTNPPLFRNVGASLYQIGSWTLPVAATIVGFATDRFLRKYESTLFGPLNKLADDAHLFLMGEQVKSTQKIQLIDQADFKYSLKDKTFDVWRSQGTLNWFDTVSKAVAKTYVERNTPFPVEIERAALVVGDSGSGKTTLINAWLGDLAQIASQIQGLKIEFLPIDPKLFGKEVVENGKAEKFDIFGELKSYLKSIKFQDEIIVVFIDEAHLFLGTENGTISLVRWVDLLNFLTYLNDEQRKNKSRGALILLAATNRPDLIPKELIVNPNRLSNVIELHNPSFNDRISILKEYLDNRGMQTSNIDFEYLSGLLEGYNLSNGHVLRIVQQAVVLAKINNTMVTTDLIYKLINQLGRNLIYSVNNLDPYSLEQIANYFSAIAAASLHFKLFDPTLSFDMVTVYPSKRIIDSKDMSQLYVYPESDVTQFGGVFYCKHSYQIDLYSKKRLCVNILKNIVGSVYCELTDTSSPSQAKNNLGDAYEMIYEYFASTRPEYAHVAAQFNLVKKYRRLGSDLAPKFSEFLSDVGLMKKTVELLKQIEAKIQIFLKNSEVAELIKKIKDLLLEKKMLQVQDLLNHEKITVLMANIEPCFMKLMNDMSQLLK